MATLQGFGQLKSGKYFYEVTEYYSKQYVSQARQDNPELSKQFQDDSEFMKQPGVQDSLKTDPSAPVWLGGIAEKMGIKGNVVLLEDFQNACAGYDPTSDLNNNPIKLADTAYDIVEGKIQTPESEVDNRRVGFEQIIGMSKEFSTLRAMSSREDQQKLDAMVNVAMTRMFSEMEKLATVRKNGKEEPVDGLLAVPHFHFENRGAKDKNPQPFSHIHFVILNTCMKDGKYYALNSESIAKHKPYLNQVFSSTLTQLMREEGYEMVAKYNSTDANSERLKDGQKGVQTMVPKVPEEAVVLFSERKIEMENNVKASRAEISDDADFINDSPTHREMAIAQKEDKNEKSKESIADMDSRWKRELLALNPKYTPEFASSLKTGKQKNLGQSDLDKAIKEHCSKNKITIEQFEKNILEGFDRHSKKIASSEGAIKNYMTQYFLQWADK